MAKMPKEVIEVFNDPGSSKVLATTGTVLQINVVSKGSLRTIDGVAAHPTVRSRTNQGNLLDIFLLFSKRQHCTPTMTTTSLASSWR